MKILNKQFYKVYSKVQREQNFQVVQRKAEKMSNIEISKHVWIV